MAIAALALLIPQALPVLVVVASALAGAAILSGKGEETRQLLEEARDATASTVAPAFRKLRDHLVGILSQPVTQEALLEQGLAPERLIAQVSGATQAKIESLKIPLSFPPLSTRSALLSWWNLYQNVLDTEMYSDAERRQLTEYFTKGWLYFNAQEAAAAVATAQPGAQVVPGAPSTIFPPPAGVAGAPSITVNLPAPNVVVQPPNVVVQPPNVVVNNPPFPPLDFSPVNIGLAGVGSMIGALPMTLASTLSATAGPNAHAAQMARYGCQGSFLAPLLQVAGRLAPQLFLGTNLVLGGPIQDAFKKLLVSPIIEQLAVDDIPGPATEVSARDLAETRLAQAIGLGMQAAGISYSLEAMTPLKTMGFGQLAGLLAEFAGFGRIANGLMGTVEDAAIYQPLRWKANRHFRPRLPSDQVIALMYQKRSLTRAELVDYLARQGFDDTVINRTPGYIFNDPNPGLLIRAFQMAEPGKVDFSSEDLEIMGIAGIDPQDPDAYFQLKFAKSGLDPTDVKAFVPVVKMGILRREQTLRYGQIERMNREGMITRERAMAEIEAARIPGPVVEYRLAAMDLQVEFEQKSEFRGLVLAAFGKEHLTAAEASTAMVDAGFDGQRVRMWMLSKQIGLTARGASPEGVTPSIDLALAEIPD